MRISDWSSDVCSSDLQREQLKALVSGKPIIRAQELRNAGIAGSTIQRAFDEVGIVRIRSALYQDPPSDVVSEQKLTEVAKRIHKGMIAMVATSSRARWIVERGLDELGGAQE